MEKSYSVMIQLMTKKNLCYEEMEAMDSKTCKEEESIKPLVLDSPYKFINRMISNEAYDMLLIFYRNNQKYYISNMKNLSGSYDKLKSLEEWFIRVIEPPPLDSNSKNGNIEDEVIRWLNRESFKLNRYTCYCDYRIIRIIKISSRIVDIVRENMKKIMSSYFIKSEILPGDIPNGINNHDGSLCTKYPIKEIDGYKYIDRNLFLTVTNEWSK